MQVLVIGAGVVGLSTAYHLNRKGAGVTVIDSAAAPAQGASYGNGGYLQGTLPDPWNAPGALSLFFSAWRNRLLGRTDRSAFSVHSRALPGLFAWGTSFLKHAKPDAFDHALRANAVLAQYTRDAMLVFDASEKVAFDLSKSGSLIIFRDTAGFDGYRRLAEAGPGSSDTKELSSHEISSVEPALAPISDKLAGAIHYPNDLGGDSRQFCQEITQLLSARGVNFQFRTAVQRIGGGEGTKSIEVTTEDGVLQPDAIVIAAGAHSAALTHALGARLKVTPAKGYSISIPMPAWTERPKHVIADMGIHAGVNPMGDILRGAGTAEFCGFKPGVAHARVDYLLDLARQVFPGLEQHADFENLDPWGGFRPLSSDGLPYIGELATPKVYVNTGHGGLGWTQAMGSGQALADLMCGDKPQINLSPYDPQRHN